MADTPILSPQVEPGQLTAIPASNYDVNKDLGRVIDRTANVEAPTAPNLAFDDAPMTGDGVLAVNPLYSLYISTLRNSPINPIRQPVYTNLSKAERYLVDDYGGFNPYDKGLENWYGEQQNGFVQFGNRLGKFVVKGLGQFANSLMDIPNTINAINEGSLNKMWDNPSNNWATDLMNWSEKVMPNYETNWERSHPFLNLIPFYGNSGNGWGKVFENLAFTVGAVGGAVVEDLAIGAITGGVGEIPLAAQQINKAVYNLGKLIGAGEDALSALKTSIKSADEIVKGLKGIDRFNYAVRQGLWGANMITSGFSEAAFESIDSDKTLFRDFKQEFFETNGRMPTYSEEKEMKDYSGKAANGRFLLNAALLSMTNTIQWGNVIRPFNVVKDVLDQEVRAGVRVALKEGSKDVFEVAETTSKLTKFGRAITNNTLVRGITGSASEGFEEGAQFTIEQGVNDFYKRKYDSRAAKETNDYMKSFSLGLSKTLGTQEGWENIVYGLLGGMMYKGGEHIYYRTQGREAPNYRKQVEAVIRGLNSQSLTGIFENKYGEGVAATSIENDLMKAVRNNNLFQFRNFKHEQFANFVLSAIKMNKYSTRIDQLQELKKLDEDEFKKTFGISFTDANKATVSEYVDRLIQHASYIKDVSDRVQRTFINPFSYKGTGNYKNAAQKEIQNKENEQHIAYEQAKEQIVYNMSVTKDSSERIGQLRDNISKADARINSENIIRLSSDEGLKDLKKEYQDRAEMLREGLKIAKDKPSQKELDWINTRIEDIDTILSENDEAKQNTSYNKLIGEVLNFDVNGLDRRRKFPLDPLVVKDMINDGRDIFLLLKRNEIAIKSYAHLTTHGGFKSLYNDILEQRRIASEQEITLNAETPEPTNTQQQAAFNQSQQNAGQTPTAQPQDADIQGYEEETSRPLTPEEKQKIDEVYISVADGKYTASEVELVFLNFQTADEIKKIPNANLKDYTQVKSTEGKVYYKLTSEINEIRARVTPPVIPPAEPNIEGQGTVGRNPLRLDDFINKAFIPNDLQAAFVSAAFSGPKDEVQKKISFTIRPLDGKRQRDYDIQKNDKSYSPVTGFPGVYSTRSPVDISIKHNNVEIAKFPIPERLLFSFNGALVTIDKLTPQAYQELTGRPASQHKQDVEFYRSLVGFKNYLALEFKNNGNKETSISPAKFNELASIILTYGELDLATKQEDRAAFPDLPYTSILHSTDSGGSVTSKVIISIPKIYNSDVEVRQRGERANLIFEQAFYDQGGSEQFVRDYISKNIDLLHSLNSRYITLVIQPDGTVRPVALRPASARKEELDATFESVRDIALASAKENLQPSDEANSDGFIYYNGQKQYYKLPSDEAKKRNDVFNQTLNNRYYITDNQGKVSYSLSVSPVGAVRLEIYKGSPVESERYRTTLYISPQQLTEELSAQPIKSFDELLDAFNTQIQKLSEQDTILASLRLSLSASNFKSNINNDSDANTTVESIGDQLTAATTRQVFRNGTLRIKPKDQEVAKAYGEIKPIQQSGKLTSNRAGGYSYKSNKYEISIHSVNSDFGYNKPTVSIAVANAKSNTGYVHSNALSGEFETMEEAKQYVEEIIAKDQSLFEAIGEEFNNGVEEQVRAIRDSLPSEFRQMAEASPSGFLEYISQSSQNYGAKWVKNTQADSSTPTIALFSPIILPNGMNLIEYARKQYPAPVVPAKQIDVLDTIKAIATNQLRVKGRTEDNQYYIIDGKQYRRVSNIIGSDFQGDTSLYQNSRIAGSTVDSIVRRFFGYGGVEKPEGIDQPAFDGIINALKEIKQTIEERGETFLSNNIVLFDEHALIAGEVDILSVDKDGNFNIYDVKTSKDFTKFIEEKKKSYTRQQSAYAYLFKKQYNKQINKLGILPFQIAITPEGHITSAEKLKGISLTYDPSIDSVMVPATPASQEMMSPSTIKTGIFAGFESLPTDQTEKPNETLVKGVSNQDEQQIKNQEDITDKEYPTVKEALAAAGITYKITGDLTEYFDAQTGVSTGITNLTPIQVAEQLKLIVKTTRNKPPSEEFDFKLAEGGIDSLNRTINIEKARAYITSILPSFISVREIDEILNKLEAQGLKDPSLNVWGAAKNGIIYLNKNAKDIGVEYHEAFHTVFNMLLNDTDKSHYLAEAQMNLVHELRAKGTTIQKEVLKAREEGLYNNLTITQGGEKLAEEWLAERFRNWKLKKENAGFFQKLFDLIERFFKWMLRDSDILDSLFRKIDSGRFRYTNIQSANFISETNDDFSEPEFDLMLIPARPGTLQVGGRPIAIKRTMPADRSKQVVQSVAAYYNLYRHLGEFEKISDDKLVDRIMDDLKLVYSLANPLYAGYTDEAKQDIVNSDEAFIYTNDESRGVIKEGVQKYINSIKYIEQFRVEEEEESEEQQGSPSTGYDNRSENIGGISSTPGLLRQYIGFASYEKIDEYGNSFLREGIPIIATVDSLHVYYGLLRALANQTDPVRMFQKMIVFSNENEQTRHFVEKLINDTGLDVTALMENNQIIATKNQGLLELVKKGFNKYRIDYVFTEHDIKKQNVKTYYANRKNVENVQFDKWANSFIDSYLEYSEDQQRETRQLLTSITGKYFDPRRNINYDPTSLNVAATTIQTALYRLGIQLSTAFIKYSVLSQQADKFDALRDKYAIAGVAIDVLHPDNKFISKQDYEYVQIMKISNEITLNRDFLDQLGNILSTDANPFFKDIKKSSYVDEDSGEVQEFDEEVDTAMVTRLLNVAKGNAFFDESVGESSYTNAENKIVYAHQDGTYHVKMSYKLRDAAYRKQLREKGYREEATAYRDVFDSDWLIDNRLLKSDEFEAIADNLLFQRIDGMRVVETNKLGRIITQEFREQKEGVTYGHYSPREFLATLMNAYISFSKEQKTSIGSVMTSPHLIRVLEASKTANMVNLPIQIDLYKNGSVTEKTIHQIYLDLITEADRIASVSEQVGKITDNVVENYHTGSFADDNFTITKGYRGLKLTDNFTSLLSPSTVSMIETKMRTDQSLSLEDRALIEKEIASSINDMVNATINILEREGLIAELSPGVYKNVLLHNDFFVGNEKLNLSKHFPDNIGHIVVNDYLNTLSYNQILYGDSALSLKNDGGIDAVKRAKGDNAAIVSMRTDTIVPELGITETFTHSSVAIFKEPKSPNPFFKPGSKGKSTIDIADAQMYTTVEGFRYTMWGLGRLTPRLARFLDALQNGEDIHNLVDDTGKTYDGVFDRANGIERWDEMTNSLKLVYKDGKSYFKMSVVLLQPFLTSYEKNGQMVAFPGYEEFHDLRTQMETKGIHFAAPQSASKMMTLDVGKASDFSDLTGHLFDNNYFGLQTENPSNKKEITTPTQLLQVIDSEQDDTSVVSLNGQRITVKQLKDEYQTYVSSKVENSADVAKNDIYKIEDLNEDIEKSIKNGTIEPRLARFQKRAVETLELSGADAQTLDFMSLDENGAPKFNLNLSAIKTKATQLYLSYFSRGILSQRSPGYTVALMSGMHTKTPRRATRIKDGVVIEWEHIRRAAFAGNIGNIQNETILHSKEQVTQEGQYFLDELQYNVPERDDDGEIIPGRYFSEMMLPPHYKDMVNLDLSAIPDVIALGLGSRIPLQDKHSMMSLRMIDFMPANLGSTGIFPKELIALSGADFDIDKLFIARYDFYVTKDNNGYPTFKRYGDANTVEERWEEYKLWMSKNSRAVKSLMQEVALKDADYKKFVEEDQAVIRRLDDILEGNASKTLRKKYSDKFVTSAFRQLNLPTTVEEFVERSQQRELNNGVINNRLVDSWIGLLTNSGIREIAQTPASLTALEQIQFDKDLQLTDEQGNTIDSVFSKKNTFPVDSVIGKYYGFKNNSTGKDNIGINVVALLTYSLMNKGNIKINDANAFIIDGQMFDTFSGNRQFNRATRKFDGPRTNDILSTLTSSATDEAKEQLNALYNLNQDGIRMVDYLVALKVPLDSAIYFVNQPSIQHYLQLKSIRRNTLQTIQEERLSRSAFREEAIKKTAKDIDDNYKSLTRDAHDTYTRKADDPITTKDLVGVLRQFAFGEKNFVDDTKPSLELIIFQEELLDRFIALEDESQFFYKVNSAIVLTKGLGKSMDQIDSLQRSLSDLGIYSPWNENIPFDVRYLLTGDPQYKQHKNQYYHKLTATNVKLMYQIDLLSKLIFMERTPAIIGTTNRVVANLKPQVSIDPDKIGDLRDELLSFIQIAAYKNWIGMNDRKTSTLRNSLIYDSTLPTIIDVVRDVIKLAPNNEFLRFVLPVSTVVKSIKKKASKNIINKDLINTIEGKTRGSLEPDMIASIMDAFTELYQNPRTSYHAKALFDYLIVKDGLMFKNKSFIRMIPPFMFTDISNAATIATKLLSATSGTEYKTILKELDKQEIVDREGNFVPYFTDAERKHYNTLFKNNDFLGVRDALYTKVFGYNYEQVYDRFEEIYTTDVRHQFDLPLVRSKGTTAIKRVEADNGKTYLHVSYFTDTYKAAKPEDKTKLKAALLKELDIAGIYVSPFASKEEKSATDLEFKKYIRVLDSKNKYSLYKLISLTRDKKRHDSPHLTPEGEMVPRGVAAVYELVDVVGTPNSVGVADLGPRPTKEVIQKNIADRIKEQPKPKEIKAEAQQPKPSTPSPTAPPIGPTTPVPPTQIQGGVFGGFEQLPYDPNDPANYNIPGLDIGDDEIDDSIKDVDDCNT